MAAVSPALTFAVPASALFLALARPRLASLSWLAVACYAVSASAIGTTGLLGLFRAQLALQACLTAQIGASVLFLNHNHQPIHLLALPAFLLFFATLFQLLSLFLLLIPAVLGPLLLLLFTLSALPLLARLSNPTQISKPISVLIPPPLPSPASSSISFNDFKHAASSACSSSPSKHPSATNDIEAAPPPPPPPLPPPPSAIRQRALFIRTRARNIRLALLVSLFFLFFHTALFLALRLTKNHHVLLSILQYAFLTLSVHGLILAFYFHGSPTPNPALGKRISISVSIDQRQHRLDNTPPSQQPELGDSAIIHPFPPPRSLGAGTTIPTLAKFSLFSPHRPPESATHTRFASTSSSFSSPRPQLATPDLEEEKQFDYVQDEGIELPVLPHTSTLNPLPSPPDTPKARMPPRHEDIRIGVIEPQPIGYHCGADYDGLRGEVVDVTVSEPACYSQSRCSSSSSDQAEDTAEVGRDWSSLARKKVLFSPLSIPTPKSPTLSFMSMTIPRTPKSPSFSFVTPSTSTCTTTTATTAPRLKSRSTMSLSLSWKKAEERINGSRRLIKRRPRPSSSTSGGGGVFGFGHRRNVSTKSTEHQWEPWYSHRSAPSSASTPHLEYIENYKREDECDKERERDTADFVDLTDPFASPTPGFALPKWIQGAGGSNGGCQDSYECNGKGKGKERQRDDEGDEWVEGNAEGEGLGVGLRTKSSAQWGRLPLTFPPPPPPPIQDDTIATIRKTKTKSKRRKRPDSPMPMRRMRGEVPSVEIPGSPLQPDDNFAVGDDETEVEERGRLSPSPEGRTATKGRRRNASPVPIPFNTRRGIVKPPAEVFNISTTTTTTIEGGGLEEEMILVQRLLRRLDGHQD